MPATSKQQFKKMYVLHSQGKISDAELKDFTGSVDYDQLPRKRKATAALKLLRKKRQ